MKTRWYAFAMFGSDPTGGPFVGVFVGPTQTDNPVVPPRARRLGAVHDMRENAIDSAIAYLHAERLVSAADALRRTV